MIELIKSWLIGITCTAMIAALADGLMPNGAVGKIGRLTGGLVLLLAIVQPVIRLDESALARAFLDCQTAWKGEDLQLEETDLELMKGIIEEQAGAYILDKAAALGISCQAEVTVQISEKKEYPALSEVVIRGQMTESQRAALTRQIEADLAVPAERQIYLEEVE